MRTEIYPITIIFLANLFAPVFGVFDWDRFCENFKNQDESLCYATGISKDPNQYGFISYNPNKARHFAVEVCYKDESNEVCYKCRKSLCDIEQELITQILAHYDIKWHPRMLQYLNPNFYNSIIKVDEVDDDFAGASFGDILHSINSAFSGAQEVVQTMNTGLDTINEVGKTINGYKEVAENVGNQLWQAGQYIRRFG